MTGYYRRFIEGFSRIALPLAKLLQKHEKFVWTEACQENFEKLKRRLTIAPELTLPDGAGGFKVYNDAFYQGLGYILM